MSWTERHWLRLTARRDDLLKRGVQRTMVIHVNDMRDGDVYIGRRNNRRGLPESPFANPFPINRNRTRAEAIASYRDWLTGNSTLLALVPTLAGKRLACWCAPEPCHGDVLVELLLDRWRRLEAATTYLACRLVRR